MFVLILFSFSRSPSSLFQTHSLPHLYLVPHIPVSRPFTFSFIFFFSFTSLSLLSFFLILSSFFSLSMFCYSFICISLAFPFLFIFYFFYFLMLHPHSPSFYPHSSPNLCLVFHLIPVCSPPSFLSPSFFISLFCFLILHLHSVLILPFLYVQLPI